MKRLVPVIALVAVLAGVFLYVDTASPPWYDRIRYPLHYQEIVRGHARNYGLDPAFLAAVIYTESKFDVNARSGLGRDRPDAADAGDREGDRDPYRRRRLPPLRPDDAEINIRYGAWYLRHLSGSTTTSGSSLAAYNAGQGNVDGWLRSGRRSSFPRRTRTSTGSRT